MNSLTNEEEIEKISLEYALLKVAKEDSNQIAINVEQRVKYHKEKLTALFNKHIDYIIGDDMEHQDKEPSYVSKIIDNVNKLKRNQRTRAGIHTKGEKS